MSKAVRHYITSCDPRMEGSFLIMQSWKPKFTHKSECFVLSVEDYDRLTKELAEAKAEKEERLKWMKVQAELIETLKQQIEQAELRCFQAGTEMADHDPLNRSVKELYQDWKKSERNEGTGGKDGKIS